jgi:hypothetical protein
LTKCGIDELLAKITGRYRNQFVATGKVSVYTGGQR